MSGAGRCRPSTSGIGGGEPIPVAPAREIGLRLGKRIVIILGYDDTDGRVYWATWGNSAEDKVMAAELGRLASAAVGANVDEAATQVYEDFRKPGQAAVISALQRERDELRARLETIESKRTEGH